MLTYLRVFSTSFLHHRIPENVSTSCLVHTRITYLLVLLSLKSCFIVSYQRNKQILEIFKTIVIRYFRTFVYNPPITNQTLLSQNQLHANRRLWNICSFILESIFVVLKVVHFATKSRPYMCTFQTATYTHIHIWGDITT